MNKYTIFVETKSRSKVSVELITEADEDSLRDQLLDCLQTDAFRIAESIFKSANVNYITVKKQD